MRILQLGALACAALLALSSARPLVAQESIPLVFQPEVGSAVQKSWTTVQRLRLAALYATVGEERRPGNVDLHIGTEQRMVVVDHYRSLREDHLPADLRRTFSTLERHVAMRRAEEAASPIVQPCSLAGTSVVFQWLPDEQDYGLHFDAKEGDEVALAGLSEDLDLRCLLPASGAAEVGSAWHVRADQLADVLAPGGAIMMEDVPRFDPQTLRSLRGGVGGSLFRAFENCASSGGLTVTLLGLENDGALARLRLEADFRVSSDQIDFMRANASALEKKNKLKFLAADLVFELRGEGHCLWDVRKNRAHSLEFKGNQTTSFSFMAQEGLKPDAPEAGQHIQMTGGFELQLVTEDVEPPQVPGPASEER